MIEEPSAQKRDLVARVATLELLVADLIELLWRVDPAGLEQLGRDAARDLEIQHSRMALPAGEHQRNRLYGVLQERRRKLQHRRRPPADPQPPGRAAPSGSETVG